jgi:uncharacterized protein
MPSVIHNTRDSRFELETSAGLAVADYRMSGNTMTIFHTEVPAQLRGRGIGERLVRGALEKAKQLGVKIVPRCWFVREFIERNREFGDLIR